MFEYSLDNGKKQFKSGFLFLILAILFGVIFAIVSVAMPPNPVGTIVVTCVFSIFIGIFSILAFTKLIFGAVVYHAERTATKSRVEVGMEQAKESRYWGQDADVKEAYDYAVQKQEEAKKTKVVFGSDYKKDTKKQTKTGPATKPKV